ncbi:MAG: hypothetical protein AAF198_00780 [Pseudomonadota bacterium]
MSDETEDTSSYPALGRALTWVETPRAKLTLLALLVLGCVISVAWDFTYEKYGYFMETSLIGFYAGLGFVLMFVLVLSANGWRALIGAREDFYAGESTDAENLPEDQFDIGDHNA